MNGTTPLVRPENGWSDPELGRVLGDPALLHNHNLAAGSLAGIVIGSLAGFAIVMAVFWLCWKKFSGPGQAKHPAPAMMSKEWEPLDRSKPPDNSKRVSQVAIVAQTASPTP